MKILTHQYKGFEFGQLAEDSAIGSKQIPKGYVNATAMCKANEKKLSHWNSLKRSKAYIEALSGSAGIPADLLIIGNESDGANAERGTWVHPDVAISIASWISPQFEVWANRVIRLALADQFTPKTADAAIAQYQLRDNLDRILNRPDPWQQFYSKEFCDRAFNWFGSQFYWEYVYCQFTPQEVCKLNTLNPPKEGIRPDKIHQYLSIETKARLTPYIRELVALINGASSRQNFIHGYARHFGKNDQLRLF